MFAGRKEELDRLNKFFEKADARVACVYGRKGMGKTTLLKEFCKDKTTIFFTAYPTIDVQELSYLAAAISGGEIDFDEDDLTIEAVLDEVTKIASRQPLLFIIDHYPHFIKAANDYDKILHSYVKEKWARLPIKVILCGDSYLQMEKKVYGKKALWRDVVSVRIELTGMDYYDARAFFPEADPQDALMYYGLSGGIPYVLGKLANGVEESIASLFFREEDDATLLPEQTLAGELRELSYYNRMLSTLATGRNRVNQISAVVHKAKDIVVPYMNTLMSIGFVSKENPVTERSNRKKTRYAIVNSHDLFWYKYMVPNMDLYYQRDMARLYTERIKPGLPDFKQEIFVRMCKEFLIRQDKEDGLPFHVDDIGNWWENDDDAHTTEGFDLVALGENDGKPAIIFARCYYTDTPIEIATLKELIELTKRAKGKKREGDVFYLVFSSSGFHENTQTVAAAIKNILLISLDEIS